MPREHNEGIIIYTIRFRYLISELGFFPIVQGKEASERDFEKINRKEKRKWETWRWLVRSIIESHRPEAD